MDKMEILAQLKLILNEINIQTEISEQTALIAESKLDSLEFINYITMVEEKFNISISDTDIEKFKLGIINNMITYLLSKNE